MRKSHFHSRVLLVVTALLFGASAVTIVAQRKASTPRLSAMLQGRLQAGERYAKKFGREFTFALEPEQIDAAGVFGGWTVVISCGDDSTNLADLTVPLRGTRPLYVFASYLLPDGLGPGEERSLFFAPEVARKSSLRADASDMKFRQLLDRVYDFGRVDFSITDYVLTGDRQDNAGFKSMSFEARISWPKSYDPGPCRQRPGQASGKQR